MLAEARTRQWEASTRTTSHAPTQLHLRSQLQVPTVDTDHKGSRLDLLMADTHHSNSDLKTPDHQVRGKEVQVTSNRDAAFGL